ncbi:heat-responsive transcription factor HSF85 [Hordeum vulgare]|uniref:HSF-type DNA-binding domain-containing protein n=1 Tax=Hordeum vulgare subsp. vulgare TaxID=112509 RepID=A0A8I6X004_HORVV|nr:heat-responsive transcription factor HSF85 [Hordeum vulgare]
MLLPAHFKPANFSSFVRQLNTYDFLKVDPDRWEFAHASFLRGHTHILRHIVRHQSSIKRGKGDIEDDDEDKSSSSSEMLAMEVAWPRNEQRATEERVAAMWRRVQETERRPKQILAFLLRVVGNPDVMRRLAGSSASGPGESAEVKRPRLLLDSDGAGVDGLSYQRSGNDQSPEAALVPEPSVDLYFAGGNGFGDV